jgi:hypothetical protein
MDGNLDENTTFTLDKYNTLMLSNERVFLSPTVYRKDLARGFVCSPNI